MQEADSMFIWHGTQLHKRSHHTIEWLTVTIPIGEGGVGLRGLKDQSRTFLAHISNNKTIFDGDEILDCPMYLKKVYFEWLDINIWSPLWYSHPLTQDLSELKSKTDSEM